MPPIHSSPDFAEFLVGLSHGEVNEKITEELARVVEAVEETGLVGEIVIKLKIKKEGTMAMVLPEVKTKCPTHPQHASVFFFGVNGELLDDNPKQTKLELGGLPLHTVSFPTKD